MFTGFVGYQNTGSTQSATYYDGQTTGLGGGLTSAQMFTASNMPGFTFGTTPGGNGWVIVDANGTLNNAGGAAGGLRPILLSEYSTSISNAHQLQLMALNLGASYTLSGDVDAAATHGTGSAGIWSAAGFVPIGGNGAAAFTGSLDGQTHTIANLFINDTTVSMYTDHGSTIDGAVGLFGVSATGSMISNVNLLGANVTGGDGMDVGALVGLAYGSVSNSTSAGTVKVGNAVAGANIAEAGGLVGGLYGSVTNSSSSAAATAGNGITGASTVAGGLVAAAGWGSSISGSHASGSVTVGSGNAATTGGTPFAGGLVGIAYGFENGGVNANAVTISASYATGTVTGGGSSFLGGFAGDIDNATVSASYATGTVTQTASGANGHSDFAGGFAGLILSSGSGGASLVTQSYSDGAVTTIGGPSGTPVSFAGGFAGDVGAGGSVNNSYSLTSVNSSGGSPSWAVSPASSAAGRSIHPMPPARWAAA